MLCHLIVFSFVRIHKLQMLSFIYSSNKSLFMFKDKRQERFGGSEVINGLKCWLEAWNKKGNPFRESQEYLSEGDVLQTKKIPDR